jgi:hypothetical protein
MGFFSHFPMVFPWLFQWFSRLTELDGTLDTLNQGVPALQGLGNTMGISWE